MMCVLLLLVSIGRTFLLSLHSVNIICCVDPISDLQSALCSAIHIFGSIQIK